eukprot:4221225-Pleurochrysis_carterae.AAC.4
MQGRGERRGNALRRARHAVGEGQRWATGDEGAEVNGEVDENAASGDGRGVSRRAYARVGSHLHELADGAEHLHVLVDALLIDPLRHAHATVAARLS